jgi:hypothetical protein
MKLRSVLMAATCATVLLSPACGFADHVRTDYNHQANFDAFHTYSWSKITVSNDLNENRIRRAVDEKLQKAGWQEVTSGGQVTVMAKDNIHTEQEAETYYSPMPDGWGGGWGWGGWGWGMDGGLGGGESMSTTTETRTAHLVIDMFDTQSKKLLWRGVSRGELSDKPDVNRKRLYDDIDHMFQGFPPKGKR